MSIFVVNKSLICFFIQYCLIIGIVSMSDSDFSDSENDPPEAFIDDSSNKVNKN